MEGDNPQDWSQARKWAITLTSSYMSSLSSVAVAAYSLGIDAMVIDLHTSRLLVVSGLSFYTLAVAIFPLFLAPLAESVGRRPVYIIAYGFFFLFFLPVALARNIETVLVARFLCGAAGSVGATMVGGTLSDIWTRGQREVPMAFFSLSALFGTPIGPIFFSWIGGGVSWRWIHWTLLISSVPSAALVFLTFNRETLLSARQRKGQPSERSTLAGMARKVKASLSTSLVRPLLLLATEPIVFCLSLWISFAWGTLYLFLESVPLVFAQYGIAQGPSFVGLAIGALIGFAIHLVYVHRSKRLAGSTPETRLGEACVGAVAFAASLFFYAWTGLPHVPWIVPQIATACIMAGLFLVYACIFMYLSECYGLYTSSALAAQSFLRNIFATAFPLFATDMYQKLTYRWASTLLGFLAAALALFPFLLVRYGAALRDRSPFATKQILAQDRQEARCPSQTPAGSPMTMVDA
ncbi:MFS general substrate transporter [Acaromyces ingoldii]|uniref:MFS general substrate transporter n=1 Tax=Acaromyces ingoldii TaxID=215250 RepID=A0A316YDC3_9BASI|nr:MFS general substrate transporter [Acaromyces ingoldii]PWN87229.1 MFS general substrate transporter [Acaromyces ingoldii]